MQCLVSFLSQLDKLEQETIKWCREILRNSPTAIRVLKSALNAVDDGHAGLQVYSTSNIFHFSLIFQNVLILELANFTQLFTFHFP